MKYLSAEQILFIHARLIEETGGAHDIRDLQSLLSALGRPQASFDAQDLYPTLELKGAALMDSLIRNHPFVDGNKRTGVAAAALLLAVNGYRLETTNADLVQNPLCVAQSRYTIEEIAAWLRSRMRPAV